MSFFCKNRDEMLCFAPKHTAHRSLLNPLTHIGSLLASPSVAHKYPQRELLVQRDDVSNWTRSGTERGTAELSSSFRKALFLGELASWPCTTIPGVHRSFRPEGLGGLKHVHNSLNRGSRGKLARVASNAERNGTFPQKEILHLS